MTEKIKELTAACDATGKALDLAHAARDRLAHDIAFAVCKAKPVSAEKIAEYRAAGEAAMAAYKAWSDACDAFNARNA